MRLEIWIDPNDLPTAQQKGERVVVNKRTGKPFVHHYEKAKVAKGRMALEEAIRDAMPAGFKTIPKGTSVFVSVAFFYPLGSQPKRMLGKPKATRPDIDNLLKGFFDACTNVGVWEDDAQVQIDSAKKLYVPYADAEPCISLGLEYESENDND